MDKYSELITQMADAFIKAVRELETQITMLESENAYLEMELSAERAAHDHWYEGGEETC